MLNLIKSSAFRTALATWLSKQCDEEPDDQEMPSDGGTQGAEVLMPKLMGHGVEGPVVDPKPVSRPPAKWSQTRHGTLQCLKLMGLGAWPSGGRRIEMADGKHSPTRRRGTARRRPQAISKVNNRCWIRSDKCSGRNTTPQRHSVGLRGLGG